MNTNQQIKFGGLISYIGIVINVIAGLLYTPWLIREIGRDDYGLYTLSLSIISLVVFDFGLSAAVQRFISNYLAEGRKEKIRDFLGIIYKLYLRIDIILLIVLSVVYIFIPAIYRELTDIQIDRFKIVYAVTAIFSVISFPFIPLNGVISAYEKFVQLKLCDLFHKIFVVVAMSVCLLYGYGLYALVTVNAVVGLLTILLKLYVIKTEIRIVPNYKSSDKTELKSILHFSGWTTVIAIAQRCIMNIAPSILGFFSGAESIAIFGVAMNLESYLFMYAYAINGMFLPKVSRIIADDDKQDILPLMIKVGRLQIILNSIIFIGFAILGREFVYLWLGAEFNDVYVCTLLLIIPSFFALPQDIADQAIAVKNKVKYRAYVYLVSAAINIVIAIPLAQLYGVIGISFSIFIAYMLRTIGMNWIYYHILELNIYVFFKETFCRLLPSLCLIMLVCIGFQRPDSWLYLCKHILAIICVYTFVMWLVGLNRQEKEMIKSILK